MHRLYRRHWPVLAAVVIVALMAGLALLVWPRAATPPAEPVGGALTAADIGHWTVGAKSTSGYIVAADIGPLPLSLAGTTTAVSGEFTLTQSSGALRLSGLHLSTDLKDIHSGDAGADAAMAQTLDLAVHPLATLTEPQAALLTLTSRPAQLVLPVVVALNGRRVDTHLSLVLSRTPAGLILSGTTAASFASVGVTPPAVPGLSITPQFVLDFQLLLHRTG